MLKFAIIRENDDDPEDVVILARWKFDQKMEEFAPIFQKRAVRKAMERMEEEARAYSVKV